MKGAKSSLHSSRDIHADKGLAFRNSDRKGPTAAPHGLRAHHTKTEYKHHMEETHHDSPIGRHHGRFDWGYDTVKPEGEAD